MADNNVKIVLTAADETRAAFDSANRNVESYTGGLVSLKAILATVSAVSVVAMIKSSIDAADKLNDLSKATKISVEQLSGLKMASQQSGTDLEAVAKSVNKLSQNMGLNAEKYAALGINSTDKLEAYKQFADVFNNIADVHQRDAFAAAALGKSWAEVAPLLAEGGDRIGELVAQGKQLSGVTGDTANQADQFNDRMVALKAAAEGVGTRLSINLLPALNSVSAAMLDVATNEESLSQETAVLTGTVQTLASAGLGAAHVFSQFGIGIGGAAAAAVSALHGDFSAAKKIMEMNNADLEKSDQEFAERIRKIWNPDTAAAPKTTHTKGKPTNVSGFLGLDDTAKDSFNKLLEASKRMDAEMLMAHQDAFGKTINKWAEIENQLIAAGAKGAKAREAHEAAYTAFVNDEIAKRLHAYNAAADKQTLELTNKQQERFAALRQAAEEADATEAERAQMKMERQLSELEVQRMILATDHELTLEEIARFEQAKADIIKAAGLNRLAVDQTVLEMGMAFKKGNMQDEISTTAAYLTKLSSYSAAHNRTMFEVNKVASIATAVMNTYKGVSGVLAEFPGPLGWAMAAAQAAMGMAQVAAIQSTQFGGGGGGGGGGGIAGGGIPSQAVLPGAPVSPLPSAPAQSPKPGIIVNVNLGDDQSTPGADYVRRFAEALNEQIRDGLVIERIHVS